MRGASDGNWDSRDGEKATDPDAVNGLRVLCCRRVTPPASDESFKRGSVMTVAGEEGRAGLLRSFLISMAIGPSSLLIVGCAGAERACAQGLEDNSLVW